MEDILKIITELLVALLIFALSFLAKRADSFIKSKLDEAEQAKLDKIVDDAVEGAEQLFKKEDEDGSIRREYVQQIVIEAGYDLTEAVMALIESKVFNLNLRTKAGAAK